MKAKELGRFIGELLRKTGVKNTGNRYTMALSITKILGHEVAEGAVTEFNEGIDLGYFNLPDWSDD